MALLSWDQIVVNSSLTTADVETPEWGEGASVRVRELTVEARSQWIKWQIKSNAGEPAPNPTAFLVAASMVGEDGARLAKDPVQQSDELVKLGSKVIERIGEKILDISGLNDAAAADAEKNSEQTESDDSPSDSPDDSDAPSPS